MGITAIFLAMLGLGCVAFGWWRLATLASQRSFGEMDGIMPLLAGGLGVVLIVTALFLFSLSRIRGRTGPLR